MSSSVIFTGFTKDSSKHVVAQWHKGLAHTVNVFEKSTVGESYSSYTKHYPTADKAIAAAKRKLAFLNKAGA